MSFIYVPFSYLMKGCLWLAGQHYIFALLFFALVMQIILLPLKIKQQKSSIKMAEVKPKEMAIREKYKGRTDKVTQQKMTMEIQNMYQENGYNQFSGCLPLLIQLPIIFILFTIVRNPITYATNLTDNNANFVRDNAQAAVEFYEDVKQGLDKDKFESADDYYEIIDSINGYQALLGATKKDEQLNGIDSYELKEDTDISKSSTAEMEVSRLMINGRDTIQQYVDAGQLDSSLLAKYDEKGFGNYTEELPIYTIGSINLIDKPAFKGVNMWLLIIPLLTFLSSFLSTKLLRKFSGSAQQTDANGNPVGGGLFMEVGMPLITAIFTFSFPAAIGVYWIWRTLIGILESFVVSKVMPIPQVTEEQIAEAKRELKSKQKKKKVITIEVDEDDNSYDDLVVHNHSNSNRKNISESSSNPTQRKPRHIEMLTADEEDETSETETDSANEE